LKNFWTLNLTSQSEPAIPTVANELVLGHRPVKVREIENRRQLNIQFLEMGLFQGCINIKIDRGS
jgi:hypothetical protein